MELPFSIEDFFDVFARYNSTFFPLPIIFNLIAASIVFLLLKDKKSTESNNRVIAGTISFLWAWMAIAYHFLFFTEINAAAWGFGAFFLAESVLLAWAGVYNDHLRFSSSKGIRAATGLVILTYALIGYPVLGYAFGHRYPAIPTFGLPCPTTIFTLGILLFLERPFPRIIFIIPLIWALIGSFAALELGVLQDLGLTAAGITALIMLIWAKTWR